MINSTTLTNRLIAGQNMILNITFYQRTRENNAHTGISSSGLDSRYNHLQVFQTTLH